MLSLSTLTLPVNAQKNQQRTWKTLWNGSGKERGRKAEHRELKPMSEKVK